MSGVPFRVDGKGRVLVSWMSRDKVYWSLSEERGGRFAPRVPAPNGGNQGSSVALMNQRGEVMLVWKEGEQVKWAIYSQEDKHITDSATAGVLPGKNKPTAFLGPDDRFYIVF
jgi:hypothetical protein